MFDFDCIMKLKATFIRLRSSNVLRAPKVTLIGVPFYVIVLDSFSDSHKLAWPLFIGGSPASQAVLQSSFY